MYDFVNKESKSIMEDGSTEPLAKYFAIKELAVKKEKQLMELNYSAAHAWDELPKVEKRMWFNLAKEVNAALFEKRAQKEN